MNSRLTILHKGLILIAVPLLFQIVYIALLAKMRRDGARAVDWALHTKDVISQAQNCRVALLGAHGSIQGFILTRDGSFEQALGRSVARVPLEFETLRTLVADNADQSAAAMRLKEHAVEFLSYMEMSRDLARAGKMDVATTAARRRGAQDKLDSLDLSFDRFGAVERNLDSLRQEQMNRSRTELESLLTGGLVTSVLFTILTAVLFSKNISGRIGSLTENTRRLAGGETLTPPISGGDEISRLDQVFHEMARTLDEASRREKDHSKTIERRAEELDAVNAQLREKAQENEMFVYSVSHDLRSPLVNLQGFGKELGMIGKDLAKLVDRDEVPPEIRRQARGMIDSDMAESIGFIQTAVTRLSGIIDGLLRLSRAGQVEYRRQLVEVGPVVARVVAALRGTIEDRKATVEIRPLPSTWGDPTAIEQVFANLIGNAINYLDKNRPGRIEVLAIDPRETAGPAGGIASGSVVYAVRDNGLGISDAYKAKVFAVFQRLHGDVAKGEGVGLALVRRMVERHGGRVWFESEPNVGTTFFVALPSAEPSIVVSNEGGGVHALVRTPGNENGRSPAWQPSR